MRLMSTSTGGLARRSFINGSKLWPPASTLASSFPRNRSTASATERGAAYLNDAGIMRTSLNRPGAIGPVPSLTLPPRAGRGQPATRRVVKGVERGSGADAASLGAVERRVDAVWH